MSNILLAGDSWGIGVFSGVGDDYGPTGEGIQSILESLGHTITNISQAGGSNWLMIDRLEGNWQATGRSLYGTFPDKAINVDFNSIDVAVFLQTDIFREKYLYGKKNPEDELVQWKILNQEYVDSLTNWDSLQAMVDDYFDKFYSKLNSIAIKHNFKILCVGGWSQLHPSISNYSNLIAVVSSATKLLIPEVKQDGYLSDPEWFSQLDKEKLFMKKFGNEFKKLAIDNADKLNLIYRTWKEVHPPIEGYQRIVNELLPYLAKKV
jgi:hypothetical protein